MYAYIWLTGSVTELQKVTKDEERTLKQIPKKMTKKCICYKEDHHIYGIYQHRYLTRG